MSDKLALKIKNKVKLRVKGFTLIELLVATAIIGVLAVMATTIFSSILRSQNKTAIINEVRQNGNIVIDKFDREVKQAQLVCVVPATPDCGGTRQSVNVTIGSGTITWDCASADFTRNGVPVINTDLDNGVRVDAGCSFTVTGKVANRPQMVTLNFTLSQRNSPTQEFQATSEFEVTVGTRAYQ